MKKLFISYALLITLGFTGAHRFYLNRIYTGAFYLGTAGFFGFGVLIDFFMIPFMVADDIERSGGDDLEFWLKVTLGISAFCFFILIALVITSILAFLKVLL